MLDYEYDKTFSNHCIFVKKIFYEKIMIFLFYGDNILIIGHDTSKIQCL